MVSGTIISWQVEGEKVEVLTNFLFLGSKSLQMVITAMKLEDNFFPGRKTMTNLDSVLESKDFLLCRQSFI